MEVGSGGMQVEGFKHRDAIGGMQTWRSYGIGGKQLEGCNWRVASMEVCKWRVASGGLQVEGCKWRVASGGLQVEGCNWRVAIGELQLEVCKFRLQV